MLIRHSAYKCLSLENIFLRFRKYTFLSSVFILSRTKFISTLYNNFKENLGVNSGYLVSSYRGVHLLVAPRLD